MAGLPLIVFLVERLRKSKLINEVIVATTTNPVDDKLVDILATYGINYFRGDEYDVLRRYYEAVQEYAPDAVVRVTGDCPLVDWEVVDKIIEKFILTNADYCSNTIEPTFPDGLDASIFRFNALKESNEAAITKYDREYVVTHMRRQSIYKSENLFSSQDLSQLRITVDEPIDYKVITDLIAKLKHKDPLAIQLADICKLHEQYPEIFEQNMHLTRDAGSKYGSGYRQWRRAQQLIPGGNMLFSKRPDLYAPVIWPTYYEKCSNVYITDLDGQEYIDMLFAVGTNLLGYTNPEVDNAVVESIQKGNISSLNCPEEVLLAEELCKMHPWADMVKFAKTGGEANAIAIRIARTYTNKTNVAICGYHGWHDWYLAGFGESDDGLASHITSNLQADGVPKELEGTCFTFEFNDIKKLEQLIHEHNIGVVKMEVIRNIPPKPGFLEEVRELCNQSGAVLIFDECTTGFREEFGGIHLRYNVWPDLAVFGKALGNGYPITCVLGKNEIMQACKNTFISSTYWSDRIGFSAALETLNQMKVQQSWVITSRIGRQLKRLWEKTAEKYGLPIHIFGYDAIPKFVIQLDSWPIIKTLFTKMMLKKGFLASNLVYVSTVHDDQTILSEYQSALDETFCEIAKLIESSKLELELETPVASGDFKRLN